MVDNVLVRVQHDEEAAAVIAVTRAAFGGNDTVARLPAALNAHPLGRLGLSLVAVTDADEVVGHVQLSRCWIDDRRRLIAGLTLSPLSVVPRWQGRGIGTALVAAALRSADERGEPFVMLEGDPGLYGHWGFEPVAEHGLTPPSTRIPPGACQICPLTSWDPETSGAIVYNDVFWSLDAVGLRG